MFELNEEEGLFRLQRYDMRREDGRFAIEVRERIAGHSSFEYYAVPSFQGDVCDQKGVLGDRPIRARSVARLSEGHKRCPHTSPLPSTRLLRC